MKHQWSSGRIVPCHGTDPAFTTHGLQNGAIKLYASLWARGIKLDKFVILVVAKASGTSSDFSRIEEVHDNAI
ncbi:hypothetical protein Lal_00017929 [Lupinus albus]|nr:hypothetical protein Lal_00017929 [Lupinus albus]